MMAPRLGHTDQGELFAHPGAAMLGSRGDRFQRNQRMLSVPWFRTGCAVPWESTVNEPRHAGRDCSSESELA